MNVPEFYSVASGRVPLLGYFKGKHHRLRYNNTQVTDLVTFSHCCDKMPYKSNLRKEGHAVQAHTVRMILELVELTVKN